MGKEGAGMGMVREMVEREMGEEVRVKGVRERVVVERAQEGLEKEDTG